MDEDGSELAAAGNNCPLLGTVFQSNGCALMKVTHLPDPSDHAETLRTVSDLLHRARLVIRDGGHAVALFEIDTLLQVAQTEIVRNLERGDR